MNPAPWPRAAAAVREMIACGALRPGDPAPRGPELAERTGLPLVACQAGLRSLAADGTLERTAFPARLQVARPAAPPGPQDTALAARLTALRRERGLAQRDLAVLLGVPVAAVEAAEAGRGGQDRGFYRRADGMLEGGGELVHLFGASAREPDNPHEEALVNDPEPEEDDDDAPWGGSNEDGDGLGDEDD